VTQSSIGLKRFPREALCCLIYIYLSSSIGPVFDLATEPFSTYSRFSTDVLSIERKPFSSGDYSTRSVHRSGGS
jgi:hypothetical protein